MNSWWPCRPKWWQLRATVVTARQHCHRAAKSECWWRNSCRRRLWRGVLTMNTVVTLKLCIFLLMIIVSIKPAWEQERAAWPICVIDYLLVYLGVINLFILLVMWAVIGIGPNGCDSMEFHESDLLLFKQVSNMGAIRSSYKRTVGGRGNENLVITGNNQPVCFSAKDNRAEYRKEQNLNHKVFPPKDTKGLILLGSGSFICQMDWKDWMFRKHQPKGLSNSATSDFYIRVENSIILNGTVMVSPPCLLSSSSSDQSGGSD